MKEILTDQGTSFMLWNNSGEQRNAPPEWTNLALWTHMVLYEYIGEF